MNLITPIIAQADLSAVSAEFIKNTVIIIAAGLAIAVYAKELFGAKKRREVSFEFEPVSKEEFQRHEEENDRAFSHLQALREKDGEAAAGSRKRLYDQISGVEKQLNEMPARIVADLVNAKKIFDK